MIETLAPYTPNPPFCIRILPWTARGNLDFFNPDLLDPLLKNGLDTIYRAIQLSLGVVEL